MPGIPAVLHAASASQALPLVAAVFHRSRRLPAPVRWTIAWCAVQLLSDWAMLVISHVRGYNLWVSYVNTPISSTIVLWTLSGWQPHALLRLSYRLAIPLLLFATAVPLLLLQPGPVFDQVLWPLHTLILLAASLHTLVHRTVRSDGPITGADWFWITLGTSLYFATNVAVRPFAQALVSSHPEWVRGAYLAKAWIQILAFLLITRGVLCHRFPHRSGGHS